MKINVFKVRCLINSNYLYIYKKYNIYNKDHKYSLKWLNGYLKWMYVQYLQCPKTEVF